MADTTQPAMGVLSRRDWQFVMAFSVLALIGVGSGLGYVMSRRAASTSSPAVAAAPSVPIPASIANAPPIANVQPTVNVVDHKAAAPSSAAKVTINEGGTEPPPALPPKIAAPEAAPVIQPSVTVSSNPQLYLQIAAGTHAGAEELLVKMRGQGYAGRIIPGPDPNTYRVLIGPAPDRELLAQLKQQLDAAGQENFVRRYDEVSQTIVEAR